MMFKGVYIPDLLSRLILFALFIITPYVVYFLFSWIDEETALVLAAVAVLFSIPVLATMLDG